MPQAGTRVALLSGANAKPQLIVVQTHQAQRNPTRDCERIIMHRSHIIEVSGQFAGAAIIHRGIVRFIAVDPRVESLDGSVWPSLPDVQSVVASLLRTGYLPRPSRHVPPGAHQ